MTGWGIDLDYRDIEWFALEMNRDHSVIFEIASKYCILDFPGGRDGNEFACSVGDLGSTKSMPQPVMLKKLKLNGYMKTYKTF